MKFSENVTLLTCTYNNNLITKMMLMSFFKQLGFEIPVIIMDNGTKVFCDEDMTSVFNVIDNHNNKLTGKFDGPSKNHCVSIDYALKNCIKTKYVLLCDNDVLFKPELKTFFQFLDTFEEDIDCVGEVGWDRTPPNRLYPYFCIINVEKLKKDKINYFDNKRCIGNWRVRNKYDTGYSFYEDIKKKKWKLIKINMTKYIVHFKGISLHSDRFHSYIDWLNKNKKFL